MEERLIQLFRQIVSEQAGLNIRDQDIDRFVNTISSRIRSLRLSSAEGYCELLKSGKGRTEWQEIVKGLTTGETYFFRDKGQFSLLRLAILPELIERNKAKKSLRIWSAGCSTGEEAYSIAILLYELAQEVEGWDILILGTDINEGAIEKAKKGNYGEWSFRQVGDEIRKRYFQKMKKEWLIDERIRGELPHKKCYPRLFKLASLTHKQCYRDNKPLKNKEVPAYESKVQARICRGYIPAL